MSTTCTRLDRTKRANCKTIVSLCVCTSSHIEAVFLLLLRAGIRRIRVRVWYYILLVLRSWTMQLASLTNHEAVCAPSRLGTVPAGGRKLDNISGTAAQHFWRAICITIWLGNHEQHPRCQRFLCPGYSWDNVGTTCSTSHMVVNREDAERKHLPHHGQTRRRLPCCSPCPA